MIIKESILRLVSNHGRDVWNLGQLIFFSVDEGLHCMHIMMSTGEKASYEPPDRCSRHFGHKLAFLEISPPPRWRLASLTTLFLRSIHDSSHLIENA
ncbi:hypothetical protein M9H77_32079 [Catharanthus roseus]|uniref:Uncharacterized protein n=1 Tax=Catharanthus roseus TaxID=4058 RepID=A0ACC0A365_CATRO|nr:hypothetical protein M9H77_32079 [Catharanthus roseus]